MALLSYCLNAVANGHRWDIEVFLKTCNSSLNLRKEYHGIYYDGLMAHGALVKDLRVGDMVLADSTVEWDLDLIDLGFPRGYVSAMDRVRMSADAKTTDELARVIGDDSKIFRGLVVSGDQFVSTDAQRRIILGAFPDALCAEMEGGAIGHVCEQNGVPFCVIRCMSDNANGDSGVNFAEFSQQAGEKSARYLLEYLNK